MKQYNATTTNNNICNEKEGKESKAQEGWVMHNTVNLLPTDAPSMFSSNWCLLTHFPQFLRWHSVVCNLSLACSGQLSHPCLSPVSCAPFTARVLKSPWSVVITGQHNQHISMLSSLFPYWTQNTALHQLPGKNLTLSQPKSRQLPTGIEPWHWP